MLKANILTLNDDKSNLFLFNLKRNQGLCQVFRCLYWQYANLGKTNPNDMFQAAKRNWDNQDHAKLPTKKTIKTIIFDLNKTYIDYGTLAWGGATRTHLKDSLVHGSGARNLNYVI